jgi:hypothetical protein
VARKTVTPRLSALQSSGVHGVHASHRKVMAGNEFILKTCPRVMRSLFRWMRNKKLVDLTDDDIKEMCKNQLWEDTMREMGFEGSRDV